MALLSVLILTRSLVGQNFLLDIKRREDSISVDFHTLTFNPDANDNIIFPHVSKRVKNIDNGSGVLVLIDNDISHHSLIQQVSTLDNVYCITGMNDAMIAAANQFGDLPIQEAVKKVASAAMNAIQIYPKIVE